MTIEDTEDRLSARIRFERVEKGFAGRWRAYEIVLDGDVVGRLHRGDNLLVCVTPGAHKAHLKIDWGLSRELDVQVGVGQEAVVRCRPHADDRHALYWISFGRKQYIDAEVADEAEWLERT